MDLNDFYFQNAQPLDLGSPKQRFETNIKAIRLAKELTALGHLPSPDEQVILSHYVGWGDSSLLRQLAESDLSDLLTDEDLRAARASSLNAHYTALPVIGAMWDALIHLGFGSFPFRILDPSAGIGHFKSAMPLALREQTQWTEIELDAVTASILKLLHPGSKVFAQGFEIVDFPQGWFDLAISNVPFGDYGISKHDMPAFLRKSIHDFFFANTVSLLRPGGILAFITSRFTLDKKDQTVRAWLARHLDLLAAVRLPETAFKDNAGTEVVTDILIMRKRNNEAREIPSWVETDLFSSNQHSSTNINKYFKQHSKMVLGKQSLSGTMYHSDGYTVESDGRDLGPAIRDTLMHVLPYSKYKNEYQKNILAPIAESFDTARNEHEIVVGQDPTKVVGAFPTIIVTLSSASPAEQERIEGLKTIYIAAKKLLATETQGASLIETSQLRHELNKAYDSFAMKHGPINKPTNIRLLKDSYEAPFLKALEEYNPTSATAKKASLFDAPMVRSVRHVESPNVDDALLLCLDQRGKVDIGYIARLCKQEPQYVIESLKGRIYRSPEDDGAWMMADEYLSGNVREKLRAAKAAVALDPSYQENVTALESALPLNLKPEQIRSPLGAGWIPPRMIEQFLLHLLKEGEYNVTYIPHLAHWDIDTSYLWRVAHSDLTSRWGTRRMNAIELIDAGLNARTVTVYDEGPDKSRIINQVETVAAQAKLAEIKAEFERWLWEDSERAEELTEIYNEKYNAYRVRKYEGSHLSTPGLNQEITLRPHQKNAVWRILQSRSTLLHHVVGVGKTLVGIVSAMESKRLGFTKKTMIAVPNHLVSQWQLSALAAYPGANVLVPKPDDLSKSKRGEFLSRVATNDWDLIVIPFSSFKLLPVSADTLADFYQREIDTLSDHLQEMKAQESRSSHAIKEVEKAIKRFKVKLENLADMKKDDDRTITFEELGVDMLIVDEFHGFKNLFFATRMTRIAGLSNSDSQRAFDMFIKFSWIHEHGGKVVGLTGTPITNTIAEMYTMQRYFQLETLQQLGLSHFDAWANQFAIAEPGLEMTPDGSGFRLNTRFRKFVNVPELLKIWFQVVDAETITPDSGIERPDLYNGKPVKVVSDGGQDLQDYVRSLASRAEKIRSGLVKLEEDNILVVMNDGRKAALDMSLVVPASPNIPMPKIDALVDVVAQIYEAVGSIRGTQLIFCDLATPKAKS